MDPHYLLAFDWNPKILVVTFNPIFHFYTHMDNIVKKTKPRVNILRLLCGTSWGQQNETILGTFKSLLGSLFTYAAPICFPNTTQISINKLQVVKNSALRIATRCVRMTGIYYLHTEANFLKVDEHLTMLCAQHLITCLQPDNASFQTVRADYGPRKIR